MAVTPSSSKPGMTGATGVTGTPNPTPTKPIEKAGLPRDREALPEIEETRANVKNALDDSNLTAAQSALDAGKAKVKDPGSVPAFHNLQGMIDKRKGDDAAARASFAKADQLSVEQTGKHNGPAAYNLAVYAALDGDSNAAVKFLRFATEVVPKGESAAYFVRLAERDGDMKELVKTPAFTSLREQLDAPKKYEDERNSSAFETR